MRDFLFKKICLIQELSSYYITKAIKIFKYFKYTKKTPVFTTNKIVLFDTCGLIINRRLAQVVLQFKKNGYDCRLRIALKEYIKTSKYDYSNIVFNNTNPIGKDPYNIIVCAKNNKDYSCKRIVFNDIINSFPENIDSRFFFPLSIHPRRILDDCETYINSISDNILRIGAVFIGNTDAKTYSNNAVVHNEYHMHSRLETLDYLISAFPSLIFRPKDIDEFNRLFFSDSFPLKNKIVIIDKFFIHGNNYLDVLMHSMFHIWTFGDLFPYCHNQFEGMACGAIPICEKYQGKPLYPGMIDKTNCFCYEKPDELKSIIKLINSHTLNTTDWIYDYRKRVKSLYDSNFSLDAFGKKIDSFIRSKEVEDVYYIHPKIYE